MIRQVFALGPMRRNRCAEGYRIENDDGSSFVIPGDDLRAFFPVLEWERAGGVIVEDASAVERVRQAKRAKALLNATDFVEFRRTGPQLSPEWLSWREQVREVIRGNRADIPPEPDRYSS